jgi:signal transduction histidine kinase
MYLRSFKFRITLLLTVIFICCSVILYVASYIIVSSSLSNEEYSFLEEKLLEFWAIYQSGNLDLLTREISAQRFVKEEKLYMVRIAGKYNNTLFLYIPDSWKGFDFYELENYRSIHEGEIIKLASHQSSQELEISSVVLPDQNILQIGISNMPRQHTLAWFRQAFFMIIIPLVVIGFFGSLFFSSRFLAPVNRLVAAIRTIIRTGRMDTKIPARKNKDELDQLIVLFNQMLSRIDSLMKSLRQTLDNVAHEIRTPLTRLRALADMALHPPYDKKIMKKALSSGITETEHILVLLNTLLDISEAESCIIKLNKKKIDVYALITDMIDFYRYPAEEKNITLEKSLSPDLFIRADINRMRQIMSNLLENAFKYTPAGGTIQVNTRANGQKIYIEVKNTGKGIARDELKHIWDRFYRSKDVQALRGSGLGLSLAKAVVEAHGGRITVKSTPGEYTIFTVSLPRDNISKL